MAAGLLRRRKRKGRFDLIWTMPGAVLARPLIQIGSFNHSERRIAFGKPLLAVYNIDRLSSVACLKGCFSNRNLV